MVRPKHPDIERITGRYLDAWEIFDEEKFTAGDLETELLRNRDPDDVPDDSSIYQDLYRVSAYGLVHSYGNKEFQVAIPPESSDDEWSQRATEHMQWVRGEVVKRQEERSPEPEDSPADEGDPKILAHNGGNYMSAFVGPNSDLDGQSRYYQAVLSPGKHTGVVLRSYQNVAASTSKLADQICDDDIMSETGCIYRFEKADEKLVDVDGDLEFRVYLDETRLLSS